MTDIGSRAPRKRPGYAWLAVGPVAAAGAIAMFIACQPAVASTPPVDLGNASNLGGLGNVSGLSGLGNTGGLAGMNGTGDTGPAHRHRHHGGDHCGCMTPATAPATTMAPTPTGSTTAPVPVPVGNNFPVTG